MLDATFLRSQHDAGLSYEEYLATDPHRAGAWRRHAENIHLRADQAELLSSMTRSMRVLVSSGIWCGDCSAQGPMLHAIASANPARIDLRWVDRDEHSELSERIKICGGLRVPTVLFMAEDYEFAALLGDRTLSRYRAIAARQLGPSCPVPGAHLPQSEIDATLQEWVNEFERVHLLLRLSPRLRDVHGD